MKIDKLLMLGYPSKYHQGDQHQAGTVERPMVEMDVVKNLLQNKIG